MKLSDKLCDTRKLALSAFPDAMVTSYYDIVAACVFFQWGEWRARKECRFDIQDIEKIEPEQIIEKLRKEMTA